MCPKPHFREQETGGAAVLRDSVYGKRNLPLESARRGAADTHLLRQIDAGELQEWADKLAPVIARRYWKLPADATMRDVRSSVALSKWSPA